MTLINSCWNTLLSDQMSQSTMVWDLFSTTQQDGALTLRQTFLLSICTYLQNVSGPGGLTLSESCFEIRCMSLNQMPDSCLAPPLAQIPAKTCDRSSTIGPYCHTLSLLIGGCPLMQIRVCPQASQSYICFILWGKLELTHRRLSPRSLPLWAIYRAFCRPICFFPFLTQWPTG